MAKRHDLSVPRNVVTLSPRFFVLPTPRNRRTRRLIEARMVERYRARVEEHPKRIAMDFSKRRRGVRDEVIAELDRADPRWPRVFVLYGGWD